MLAYSPAGSSASQATAGPECPLLKSPAQPRAGWRGHLPSPASEPRAKGRVSTCSLTVLCHLPWNVGSGRAGPCQFLPVLQQGSEKLRTRPLLSKPVPREHAAGWVREGGWCGVEPIAGSSSPRPPSPGSWSCQLFGPRLISGCSSAPANTLIIQTRVTFLNSLARVSPDCPHLRGHSFPVPVPARWCWRLELCPDALPLPRFHPHAAWPPRFVSWL